MSDEIKLEQHGTSEQSSLVSSTGYLTCPECGRQTKPEDMCGAEECADCMNHRQEAEAEAQRPTMMQVTREMAHDAGDPSMEGAWIEW